MPSPLRSRPHSSTASHVSLTTRFAVIALLLLGSEWTWCGPARSQAITTGAQPPSSVDTFSPLNPGAGSMVPPVGIPLGSTELATPGISPALPSPSVGSASASGNCSGSSQSSQSTFDGGGLSGGSSACIPPDAANASGRSTTTFSVGRSGIPLGSTELGSAGLSPAPPILSTIPSTTGPTPSSGTMPCPSNGGSMTTAAASGC